MRTVLMFPGQGSQYYGMGRALHGADEAFRAAMDRCDQACGPINGLSVSQVIASRPVSARFDDPDAVTPCLLAVGWSLAQALAARGVRPDLLLGASFGETVASVVAGTLDLPDAFALVRAQSALIARVVPPGHMVAVLGAWDVLRLVPEVSACTLAAVNSPRHFVLALPPERLDKLRAALERRAVPHAVLPVRHAFHSAAIEPARDGLAALAAAFPRRPPSLPVLSCMSTRPYDPARTDHFWQVSREPIRFADTVRAVAAAGPCRFIESGPSGSLATFARQTLGPGVVALPTINPFGNDLRTMAAAAA